MIIKNGLNNILAILLDGTIIDKLNILKNIKIPEGIEVNSKIGVYSGMIDSSIKKLAGTNNIKLMKTVNFESEAYNIALKVNDKRLKKLNSRNEAKRSRLDIEREILNGITSNHSLPLTRIVYMCNLNYQYCSDLINHMIKNNLLEIDDSNSRVKYRVTLHGLEYLKTLEKI